MKIGKTGLRHSGQPFWRKRVLLRMARFPPVWALILGLTVMPEQPPQWVAAALQKLADALLPLVMLAVGLSIQLKLPRDDVKPLYRTSRNASLSESQDAVSLKDEHQVVAGRPAPPGKC